LVAEYLYDVKKHMLENLLDFVEAEEQAESEMQFLPEERDKFRKYRVNVFIDNTQSKGAPVIIETNPTYYNLFGRIEKNVEHGMYLTDFTMIKAGAVHRANGGYLVLNAMDIFKTPSIWDTLKRVLKNRLGFIEDMGEQYSLLPTSGLRPIPIPLDIKVILIGNDEIYHVLFDGDEDFQKIFKIKADFDHKMPRIPANINAYASFIATRTNIEKLLPFAKDGISAVVEYGSRLVEDQRFLSTQYGQLKDLTIESDYVARAENATIVTREHVEHALDLKYQRLNLTEDHLLEMVRQEDILLQVDGMRVGQVNGLAVYDMGDYSFGKIGRITCTISTTDEGVLNIERASKLSGKIHDKGIYILSSFMNALLAKGRKLGIAAAVCFEQSYGMIDGDSATVAELVAILSAIAEIPVKQNVAMTGSLNQFGDVQPVGGINEKIEGFYKTAKLIGNSKDYMCLIPHQNVPNLMLSKEVRAAVDSGALKIFPIKSINDAFEIVTGVPLGFNDINSLNFEKGTALHTITKKLENIHEHQVEEERHIHVENASKPTVLPKKKSAKGRIKPVGKSKKRK
jgi:lon-related putative ATP-dependent protease